MAPMKQAEPRSYCPINLSLETFGDAWTLLVLRDMMFAGKRHFREMLQSEEGIASNVLASRLKMLVDRGMITKADDPTHKQKAIYSLTEKGISLLPILAQIGIWGRHHLPESEMGHPEVKAINRELERGGPRHWEKLMSTLREQHLGKRARAGR
jgi:DNA-binding HxlR family transcriptional regulator